MKNSLGIALITVLIFLLLLSLLGITLSETSAMELRMSRDHWQKHHVFELAEGALQEVENSLAQHAPTCLIPVTPTGDLLMQPPSWWAGTACHGDIQGQPYDYVEEYLQQDPCVKVNNADPGGNYYRVTILTNYGSAKSLLQSVILQPVTPIETCKGVVRQTHVGRQAWRELNQT